MAAGLAPAEVGRIRLHLVRRPTAPGLTASRRRGGAGPLHRCNSIVLTMRSGRTSAWGLGYGWGTRWCTCTRITARSFRRTVTAIRTLMPRTGTVVRTPMCPTGTVVRTPMRRTAMHTRRRIFRSIHRRRSIRIRRIDLILYAQPGAQPGPPGSIDVQPGETSTGGLSFEITPTTAQVFVDGNYVGTVGQFTSTSQPLGVAAGHHRVDIRAPDYQTISFDVDIIAGQVIPYQGTMER